MLETKDRKFLPYQNLETKKEVLAHPDFGHENLPSLMDNGLTFLGRDIL